MLAHGIYRNFIINIIDIDGGPLTKMPTKLKDTLEKVRKLDNRSNSELLIEFYEYLRAVRTSERYQSDILKILVKFSEFVDDNLIDVQKKEQVIAFLNTKVKNKEEDPDERWITTWNDYLWRIKYFYRWLYKYIDIKFTSCNNQKNIIHVCRSWI